MEQSCGAPAQPADVCAFAATYFADLAKQSAAPGGSTAPEQGTPQSPTAEEAFLVARRVDTAAAAAAAGLAGAALEVRGPSTAVCSTTTITNGS